VRVQRADPAVARRQATWIVTLEPWRSMGYAAAPLGRWLARLARAGGVSVVREGGDLLGIAVVQPDVLLGDFIALVAVRPEAAGRGVGRALVEQVAARTFKRRRWLWVSSDAQNRPAAAFYRKLGFARAALIPDLVREGRSEILWRRGRS
jgi:ribosomal protein S18 acetylase RimI-like enzyme